MRESTVLMDEIALSAEPRTVVGKQVKQLRREGLIPATVYGRGIEPQSLQIHRRDLASVLSQVGTTQLVNLEIKGKSDARKVLIREVQQDVIDRDILHVDLYAVVMSEKITAELRVVFLNESPAVKDGLGVVVQGLASVRVECLPGDLVAAVEISLESLVSLHDSVTVADLDLGDAIEILEGSEEIIVQVVPLAAEEIEEEVEELEEEMEEKPEGEAEVSPEDEQGSEE